MNVIFKILNDNPSEYEAPTDAANESKRSQRLGWVIRAVFVFAIWSLRRRAGQCIPVACAFLLLICSAQTIGTLHDIASIQTRQQIAQSWRGPYDLLVRPPASISPLERTENWIDPQSSLESYGGISQQQLTALSSVPQVIHVTPFATVGWQSMLVQTPLLLPAQGLYQVSAIWSAQGLTESAISVLVDVTDLAHLTTTTSQDSSAINYLVAPTATTPVWFNLSVPAIQDIIGIPTAEQATLSRLLLAGIATVSPFQLTIHVEKLLTNGSSSVTCRKRTACWQPQLVQQGTSTYQSNGVQMLRFSPTLYTVPAQSNSDGQPTIQTVGTDLQGPLYRVPLTEHVAVPESVSLPSSTLLLQTPLLPLTAPEHLPLLPGAAHFISLEQACTINGPNCYSGVYLRISGAERYSQSSVALLQATAATITERTGLHVDILDGSSLRTVTLSESGNTPLHTLQTTWRAVGVAVQIVHGLDTMQEMLLILCAIVCLLAVGLAGILVGISRQGDVLLLQQLGWEPWLLVSIVFIDALFLCLPGCLLAALLILLVLHAVQTNLPVAVLWSLMGAGVLCYCTSLVIVASIEPQKKTGRRIKNIQVVHGKVMAPLASAVTVVIAVFLIVVEYLVVTSFNQVLVVTVLGKQVREALETSQIALLVFILLAALTTVMLCTILRLRGRREEIALLAMVGWERRDVVRRLLWSSWIPALISGEIGVLLALGLLSVGGVFPGKWSILGLLLGGPLLGVVLVSLAALGPLWYETQKVFV